MRKTISELFFDFLLKSLASRIVPKLVHEGTVRDFLIIYSVLKDTKLKGEPLENVKIVARKKISQSQNTMHKQNESMAGLEPTSFCLADLKIPK